MEQFNHLISLLELSERWSWTTELASFSSSSFPALINNAPAEFITIFSQCSAKAPIPQSTCQGYWRQDKETGEWLFRVEHHHTVFNMSQLSNTIEENEFISLRIEKMIMFVTTNKIKVGHWWETQLSQLITS